MCLVSLFWLICLVKPAFSHVNKATSHGASSLIINHHHTPNNSINYTHIAIDYRTNSLYIGASNWIYQLNSELNVVHKVKTGPVLDSPHCSPANCDRNGDGVVWTTNFNKVLLIDEHDNKLIACGSAHQGSCSRYSLEDIRHAEQAIQFPVAANDENSSTYAFIGPARYGGRSSNSVLYVGTTNTRLGPYREMVPAISSRSLESGPKLFSIIETSFSDSALVNIESHLRDYFLVKYVFGFYTDDHVYFATLQKRSHLRAQEELGYVTRLARVCASDSAYNTYTEVTLSCLGKDGEYY